LIYDKELDVTWLQDANYAATQFANSGGLEGDADGLMGRGAAMAWADDLVFGGATTGGCQAHFTTPALAGCGEGACVAAYSNTSGIVLSASTNAVSSRIKLAACGMHPCG